MAQTQRATPPLLKDLNERTVLEVIRSDAPISRAEISRRAGISKPTVSQALESLVSAGLVREAAEQPGGPSYGALFFESVPEAALVVGIDVGARFIRGAVSDLAGRIRGRRDVELQPADAEHALDTIASLCDSLVPDSGLDATRVDSVVIGVPGVVEAGARIALAENVPGLEGRDVASELSGRLPHPVTLENDINLAAVGEQWRGIAQGIGDFAFLSIGTGLGCGIVLGGELHRGHNGAAGELDFVRVGLREDVDPCAGAVSALAAQLADEGVTATALAPPFDARSVFTAARQGDPIAGAVIVEEARRIALHILPIAATADVALIVLGGGIGANGDLLLGRVRGHLENWLSYPPRVEVSSLGEAAVLTGALAVGLESARNNVFVNRAKRG